MERGTEIEVVKVDNGIVGFDVVVGTTGVVDSGQ